MRLLAVDGNSILNRAYYGIRPLTTKDGQYTHAIYGFLTMLEKIKADTNPEAVAIAFDLKAPTFRHKAYSGYKATRKGMPEELASQVEPLKELLTLLGYSIVSCEGYEADDILGTFARVCEEQGNECVIATGDRDSLQLVSDKVTVRLASTKQGAPTAVVYDRKKVMEEYSVEPVRLIDIKALQGDTSDNIPGVAGIGPKGASDLISKFGSLDGVYENIDSQEIRETVRKKLIADKENAYLSLMLGEIYRKVPVDTSLEHYKVNMTDADKAARYMARLELFKLIDKFGLREVAISQTEETSEAVCVKVQKPESLQELTNVTGAVADAEFTEGSFAKLYVYTDEKVFVTEDEKLFCEYLKANVKKAFYDSKPVYAFADKMGIDMALVEFDVSLAAYLLNPSSSDYSPERLCAEYRVDLPKVEAENAEIVEPAYCALPELSKKLRKEIEDKNQKKLLDTIEIPLARVLAKMENSGFAVDREGIEKYGEYISEKLADFEQEIYTQVGYEFNINSPKQLGVALFEKLGLPAKKKTKSGYSTNADVLEDLRNYHPVVGLVLEYRTYAKLKSTYCEGLLKVIAEDGRIHSSFNQKETRTGRISSTEPNLQNIPVRTQLGRELRKFFVAKEGCVLVDADYSQIELRVLAHLSQDQSLIDAFNKGEDIHRMTASRVLGIPAEQVTVGDRSRAKAVNFGVIYGMSGFGLSEELNITRKEAEKYIEEYFRKHEKVREYMDNQIADAKKTGYSHTILGRKRAIHEINASAYMVRQLGERLAMNSPIQGSAADIIKIAMIKVYNELKEKHPDSELILQVHDELIIQAKNSELEEIKELLVRNMESAMNLSVKLLAEVNTGSTWYDLK